MSEHKHTNALINESSPYLLQHAHNPVQWYPWGAEALAKAKAEDKPILLSVGYSACHWCHIMEHESFENEEIADLMNKNFVNIKVDREERPDIDSIYMAVVQMMTGGGGWPMTVFLTPDQIPFYCGTYFPPESRYGRPGFRQVLVSVAQAYRERKQAVCSDAKSLLEKLRRLNAVSLNQRGDLSSDVLEKALARIVADYDARYGGFGRAPKFPPSMTLNFLMRSYLRIGEEQLLEIIDNTLTRMACGGIYDQLGGGFHRYSVDAQWLVPHFEKMLYDNALLARAYLDAYLLTGKNLHRRIAEETLDYVAREMTSPEGGFYSSQDADSDGKEGAFFLWTPKEIEAILGEEHADLFCCYYDVTPEGNFEGKNILNIPRPLDLVARLNRISEEHLLEVIQRGRTLLFEVRESRAKPGRDEKILTAWNGLMLRSFAEAAGALDREDYRRIAVQNAEFLISRLGCGDQLLRSYKDGRARFNAYLEDYACLIDGLISLYETTFEPRWILEAEKLANRMIRDFRDPKGGGFYFTSEDHETLIHRPKEFYDGAIPSGNSVSAHAMLRLWKFTGEERWSAHAVSILKSMTELMGAHPQAFAHLLCVLDFYLSPPKEIAIAGEPNSPDTRELLDEIYHAYLPNKVLACGAGDYPALLKDKPQRDGLATAYVCENFVCKAPVTSAEALRVELGIMKR